MFLFHLLILLTLHERAAAAAEEPQKPRGAAADSGAAT